MNPKRRRRQAPVVKLHIPPETAQSLTRIATALERIAARFEADAEAFNEMIGKPKAAKSVV